MLSSLFLFSLKSSVVLCVLYLAYHFLFKKNTHFHIKRGVLLLIIGASLSLPLLQYQTSSDLAPESPSIHQFDKLRQSKTEEVSLVEAGEQTTTEVDQTVSASIVKTNTNWLEVISIIYVIGVIFMFILFLTEIVRLSWILGKGKARHDLNRMVVTHKLVKFPFSFWRWIFLPNDLTYNDQTWELIQEHENVHLNQGHTLDILFSTILRCLLWFNPAVHFLQKDIKDNHEALADRTVLEEHDMSKYSKALLEVCLQTGSLNLGHAFALKSNLSKRINTMNLSNTTLGKSVLSLLWFGAISIGVFTQTSLYSQNTSKSQTTGNEVKSGYTFLPLGQFVLSDKHKAIFDKLKRLYPEKNLRFNYLQKNSKYPFSNAYSPHPNTEFFGEVSDKDKEQIFNGIDQERSLKNSGFLEATGISKEDFSTNLKQYIKDHQNYIVIYEHDESLFELMAKPVYEMDEVDVLPRPLGGLESFEHTIALDLKVPDHIQKEDLPELIEFEFVVLGGNHITELNLRTELKGNKRKQDDIYKFFGTLHKSIIQKIGSYYSWEKGIKDNKEVNVRMIVSIPTKYM